MTTAAETASSRRERALDYTDGTVAESVNECELGESPRRYLVLEKASGGEVVNYYDLDDLGECAEEINQSTTGFEDVTILDLDAPGEGDMELAVVRNVAAVLNPGLQPLVLWRPKVKVWAVTWDTDGGLDTKLFTDEHKAYEYLVGGVARLSEDQSTRAHQLLGDRLYSVLVDLLSEHLEDEDRGDFFSVDEHEIEVAV